MLKRWTYLLAPVRSPGPGGQAAHVASHVSPAHLAAAQRPVTEVLLEQQAPLEGLSDEVAKDRRTRWGPNVLESEPRFRELRLFLAAVGNPLVLLLLTLSGVSYFQHDRATASIMLVIALLGVGLRFLQESRANQVLDRLQRLVHTTATVIRSGARREIATAELVPGDLVEVAVGDLFPADLRLVTSHDLYVSQSTLTGESLPVEKSADPVPPGAVAPLDFPNLCFLGTSVESGTAHGVVIATGSNTCLGSLAEAVRQPVPPSSFERGISQFTWLMLRFVAVLVPSVFVLNGWAHGNWHEALLFALAVAVGLTPEMLPMIVTVCLSRGAVELSRRRLVVKRLNAIQNLGAMDVLCTDKTGTLTADRILLERHCDVHGHDSEPVLALAYLNSHFQTGLRNVMDRCVLEHSHLHAALRIPECEKVDEIPFDFTRRVMSVVVRLHDGTHRLICKGAPEAIFARCTSWSDGEPEVFPMSPQVADSESVARPTSDLSRADAAARSSTLPHTVTSAVQAAYRSLSADGFRVLAVASRDLPPQPVYSPDDERDLTLHGYLAFLDPPKDSARPALAELAARGVRVMVLTGDNDLVSRKICEGVGLVAGRPLLGEQVDQLDDAGLQQALQGTTLCARLSPVQKRRVIAALQGSGHVVGFLGDGINDAPALRVADVGLSVDTAVDIARESADAILLEKDLRVLATAVVEGRRVYVNILKYIRMGASSNFGNMLSVVGASLFLPYLPMTPLQILTNNLLYDLSQVPIPGDRVDEEQVARPLPWSMDRLTRFIVLLGPCSSLFDITTWVVLLTIFDCGDPAKAPLFRSGWFVESLLTQTLVIHLIRTDRMPFVRSRASWPLLLTTLAVAAVGVWLPGSAWGAQLGFVPLPAAWWGVLLLTLLAYAAVILVVKRWVLRRGWL